MAHIKTEKSEIQRQTSAIKAETSTIKHESHGPLPGPATAPPQPPATPRITITYPKSDTTDGFDPCTQTPMEHLLICGHTIGTNEWEQCAANCMNIARTKAGSSSARWEAIKQFHFPLLDENDVFMCRACHEESVDAYLAGMGQEPMTEKERDETPFEMEELRAKKPMVNWRATYIAKKVVTEALSPTEMQKLEGGE